MRSKLMLMLLFAATIACAPAPERLSVEGRQIVVLNDSGEEWRNVEIWVNHHFRATKPSMAPGERLVAPLSSFVAAYGQTFPGNQRVNGVEVTAEDASGDEVKIVWGEGRRK